MANGEDRIARGVFVPPLEGRASHWRYLEPVPGSRQSSNARFESIAENLLNGACRFWGKAVWG